MQTGSDLFFGVLTTTIQGIMKPQGTSLQPFSAEEAFKGIFTILYEGALTDKACKKFKMKYSTLSSNESPRYI